VNRKNWTIVEGTRRGNSSRGKKGRASGKSKATVTLPLPHSDLFVLLYISALDTSIHPHGFEIVTLRLASSDS
jgi:hypothetical protein